MEHNEYLIGIAVQTVLFLLGGYGMVLRNKYSNDSLKEQMEGMQKELEKLASVIVTQAVQTTRIDTLMQSYAMLNRTVEDLRRGDGWIGKRKGIDGEYP